MADISNLFKATVKSINSRNKALNENHSDVSSLFLSKKQRSDFELKAKNLVKTITKLRDFLLENRKNYVNSGSLLSNNGSRMSESERDQIDTDAQQIIKNCRETIILFRVETDKQNVHPQVKEHRNAVMILIESYLKIICKIYSEQKAVRVKRVVDKKKISRLEPERKHNSLVRQQLKKELNIDQDKKVSDDNGDFKENKKSADGKTTLISKKEQKRLQPYELDNTTLPDDELSPEEMQMVIDWFDYLYSGNSVLHQASPGPLRSIISSTYRKAVQLFEFEGPRDVFEQENQALYNEMNSMSEDVRQIEGQVVEIAKLQEIFTEKILEQDVQIHSINNTAVGTTENIKDANEEIREAIKKKAEFRVWILFFLVVCSFSLLFLDWYNV